MKNKNWLVFLLVVIMLSGIITSMLTSIQIIDETSTQNSEQRTHILSTRIHDSILNEMIRPITVTETMANDNGLIALMERANKSEPKDVEDKMAKYLESIRKGFGYKMVFAVCDATKAYYTYEGYSKTIDPKKNSHDIWYKEFCESGKYYDLDVDTDRENNWELSVFVNMQIKNNEGKLLGICGVGIEMTDFQELIKKCEDDYHIKINLLDSEGNIQVDTDGNQIEKPYLGKVNLSKENPDEFTMLTDKKKLIVSTYIKDLDWFLVLQDEGFQKIELFRIIWPSITILLVGMFTMGVTFYIMHNQKMSMKGELSEKVEIEKKQMDILTSISRIYLTSHVINIKEDTIEELSTAEHVRFIVNRHHHASKQINAVITYTVMEPYQRAAREFTDLSTLVERMKNTKILVEEFEGIYNGWFRGQIIANSYDKDGNVETVIFTTQIIDDEKRHEEDLVRKSMTDQLTGLYNRRAYEERLEELETDIPDDLVIISMDINGLKNVNDTIGHDAGDELIRGAAKCMMSVFLYRGEVYRIGGDEFIAILNVKMDEIDEILLTFLEETKKWRGNPNLELSISCGVVSRFIFPDFKISELIAMADKCMYNDKNEYYREDKCQ